MPKTFSLLLSACLAALGLTACGSSSKSNRSTSTPAAPAATAPTQTQTTPTGPASAASIAADPSGQLKFTASTLSAKAGQVTIEFTNSAPLAHNLTIQQGAGGSVLGATPTFAGGEKTLTLTLKPGTYTFYCSVPGHRQAGMQGTLTVS